MGNAGHEQAILALRARWHDVEVLTQIDEPSVPRAAVALALQRAALVRVNSPFMVGYLASEGLATSDRVVMVPRVLESTAFPPDGMPLERFRLEGRRVLLNKYGLGLPRPIVMSL